MECLNLRTMFFVSFACLLHLISVSATAVDTIVATQPLENGDTLVSSGGVFELGFFSIGNPQNQFVGIWYKKISTETKTVVWVANRDHPLNGSSGGALKLTKFGSLVLIDASNTTIWSSNSSDTNVSPIAQLLDSGNLVVRNNEDFLWQSFDHPGDTLLPGMKYGINFASGLNRYLTSWKRPDDPGTGEYYNKLDSDGLPQFFLYKGSAVQFRSGAWNGLRFSGMPNLKPNNIYKYQFVSTEDEVYYTYQLLNDSLVSRFMLNTLGVLQRYTWIDRTQGWVLYLTGQMDNCDTYAQCGPHGTCNINNSPACECLKGFVPKYPHDWESTDWSNGCVRKAPFTCGDGEGFLKYLSVKWPDTKTSWYNKTMTLEECQRVCLKNCSCTAYSSLDVRNGGTGCLLWFGDLIDIRNYPENGQDIYVKMAASEIEANSTKGKRQLRIILIPTLCVALAALLLGISFIFCALGKKKQNDQLGITGTTQFNSEREYASEGENDDLDLPLFDFATIADATENFSLNNKLGQGGFGPVYKGVLRNGQEIAVKRLSRNSRQGLDEFKNEVQCIAKLQHRNLVKLLGCCIQVEERLLIYEYMSNKSLDIVIFDKKQRALLDWPKRFHIINGIARGLLYLHQDSRLRIIHRDLKASNILLDESMNPKISDFGMARSFGGDETSANTSRVVGTYGYMSPEYAIDGLFSMKSDIFSFGVLVLEIVSGKRNRGFSHPDHKMNLLGHTWKLHNEGRPLELIEASTKDSCNITQTLRAIHVGLLCVQQNPEDRPNMSTVVLMLTSDIALPQPKEPGFYTERYLSDANSSSSYHVIGSTNGLTVTLLHPR